MRIPWKSVLTIGSTIVVSAASAVMQQYQQQKTIEDLGQKIAKEIKKDLEPHGNI